MSTETAIPPFYHSSHAGQWAYRPNQGALFALAGIWRAECGLAPAAQDDRRVHLLLVDMQKDFCFPEGSLYVGGRSGLGAVEDSNRVARFIYQNLGRISEITCTLDSHYPFQIFSPSFWVDAKGQPATAHLAIATEDVRNGSLRPNPDVAAWLCNGNQEWLQRQVEHYCAELERVGKYTLYLWPPHCLVGSEGHTLTGVIHEARLFHAYTRGARNVVETKGGHPLTENYSVLSPEVLTCHDGSPLAERNSAFVDTLLEADALVVAGQASSHCVKSSLEDLLGEIQSRDPGLARKVYILRDGMSAVALPDPERPGAFLADFTPQAEETLDRMAAAGMHLVETTRPMSDWPGL